MIEIRNVHAKVDGKEILKGIDLVIEPGKIHAIMGPNGAGKSTLARVLAGHPSYEVTEGEILFLGKDLLEMEPEERAMMGLFMGFQYPVEIAGVSNLTFLHTAYNCKRKAQKQEPVSLEVFETFLDEQMEKMHISQSFKHRGINEGFSGGEKKRNEILQMAVLDPIFSVLDETDSGLDIDAMRIVSEGILKLKRSDTSILLITHYQRLLQAIKPDVVHVMQDGKIVRTGDASLAEELEVKGYATC